MLDVGDTQWVIDGREVSGNSHILSSVRSRSILSRATDKKKKRK